MKKKTPKKEQPQKTGSAYIEGSGTVVETDIVTTLEENYMPYAMSVIVSRALPEIDGFKPSHRKLLYTMYKMGLLNGARTKSANIVGQTMKLNPHGDAAIYETMVRLARGNEALLHPYVDSKGNFGKAYSRDMAYAAARYTEAKLDAISAELFADIDKDAVDMVPNYDNEMLEPTLFPVRFPSVLVNNNMGIAVSMASNICSFNLAEVCETAISLIKNPDHNALSTLKGPDFPGGGYIVYDEVEMEKIYRTGLGAVKVRAKYNFDKESRCIEVTEIPPTTTVEALQDKIVELVKDGKLREISDVRDEIDLSGMRLAIDVKKGYDPDALMQKLFKLTPLQDNFNCNFNVLIAGTPRVMGVYEILSEWTDFRRQCVKRRVYFDLNKKKEKLHLLLGLKKILLDIDYAIQVIRETEEEAEVVPNLMVGFGIDEPQAEYVAEIKLRHINREYILKRTRETDELSAEIAEMEDILNSPKKIDKLIIAELKEVSAKYAQPRRTMFLYDVAEDVVIEEEEPEGYPVNVFFTREGYFKQITPKSLRMSGEQKLKEQDEIIFSKEVSSTSELLFFTNKFQCYKSRCADFPETKASVMGDYVPAKLGMDEGELPVFMAVTESFSETLVIFFRNGKCAKIPLSSYATKTQRKKLLNAYSDLSELVAMFVIESDEDFILKSTAGKVIMFNTALVLAKSAKNTQGVQVMRLTKAELASVQPARNVDVDDIERFRIKTVPAAGVVSDEDIDQLRLD
ncbi:MAG: DNA topoisomerase (ATP-hydrolyzing) subunit A [Lachnospiraceae bacterium]|nr:DNA topoisomerase (ATP-hydrolyzing) subunit A [Ruminococcus sp.]MCM1275294.1 DNA topoisomerase (ATP-hydrolyzing) subunit A [Lachnospiraceae bacterium]